MELRGQNHHILHPLLERDEKNILGEELIPTESVQVV